MVQIEVLQNAKPCPGCNAVNVSVSSMLRLAYSDHLSNEDKSRLENRYCVRCEYNGEGCNCMSPSFDTKEEAIAYWNEDVAETNITIGGGADAIKTMSKM